MKIQISEYPPYFLDVEAPTLGAEAVAVAGCKRWRVWCKHCREYHNHGPAEGHREAHCTKPGSPYAKTGYNLALIRTEDEKADPWIWMLLIGVVVILAARLFLFPL